MFAVFILSKLTYKFKLFFNLLNNKPAHKTRKLVNFKIT